MDWTQILTVFVMVATNLITVMALYVHTDAKMEIHRQENFKSLEDHRKESHHIMESIRQEIRDFHQRMCEIEAKRGK